MIATAAGGSFLTALSFRPEVIARNVVEANQTVMKAVTALDVIGHMLPGSAIIAQALNIPASTREIAWLLREDSRRLKALAPTEVFQLRAGMLIEDKVAAIPILLRVGQFKPRNIWTTWLNVREPGSEQTLELLAKQPRLTVYFVGDQGTVVQSCAVPNVHLDFAVQAMAAIKQLPSWTAAQFEQLKDRLCQKHPDVISLWQSLSRSGSDQDEVQQHATTMDRRQNLNPDAESLRIAESTYMGLSEPTRDVLVCLAPFTGAVNGGALESYCLRLKNESAMTNTPLHEWGVAIHEARENGLLHPHPVDPAYLAISPAFTLVLRHQLESSARREVGCALDRAFRTIYQTGVRSALTRLTSSDPDEVQAGRVFVHIEYDNILAALELALTRRGSIITLYSVLDDFLVHSGHHQRGVELGERILAGLDEYGDVLMEGGVAERVIVIRRTAHHQRVLQQHEAAEAHCRKALELYSNSPSATSRSNQEGVARMFHELGLIAYEQRRWEPAVENLRKSLRMMVEMGDQVNQASILHSLGRVAAKLHDWPQAKQAYEKSMDVYASLGDRRSQAAVCLDLASAASLCAQRLDEAKQYFHRALPFVVEFGEKTQEAAVHHNLGDIAQFEMHFKRAWKHYRRAIRIFFEIGDHANRARSYSRLGALMGEVGQRKMARRACLRALKLAAIAKDRFTEALTIHELGNLSRRCHKWERAAEFYDKAMEIYIAFDDSCRQAGLRLDMGRLAYKQGQWTVGQEHLLAALRQSVGSEDVVAQDRVVETIARLWRKSGDMSLPAGVAGVLGTTAAEAESVLRKALLQ
jgi:tetratricopeptide (TPR) repeat protein